MHLLFKSLLSNATKQRIKELVKCSSNVSDISVSARAKANTVFMHSLAKPQIPSRVGLGSADICISALHSPQFTVDLLGILVFTVVVYSVRI